MPRRMKKPFKKGRLYDYDTKYLFSTGDAKSDAYTRRIHDLSIQFSELLEIPDPDVIEIFVLRNYKRLENSFSREDWKELIIHSTRNHRWSDDLLFCYSSRYLFHEREDKILRYESLAKTNAVLKFLAQFEHTATSFKFNEYYLWQTHADSFFDFLQMLYEYCCIRMCPNADADFDVAHPRESLRIRFGIVCNYLTANPRYASMIKSEDFLGYVTVSSSPAVIYQNLARRGVLGHLPFLHPENTERDEELAIDGLLDSFSIECRRNLIRLFQNRHWRELPISTVEQCCRVARFFVGQDDRFVQEICPFLTEISSIGKMCIDVEIPASCRILFNIIYTESCFKLEKLCQAKYLPS